MDHHHETTPMLSTHRPFLIAIAVLIVCIPPNSLSAEVTDACSLFTKAEFDAVRGTPSYAEPAAVGSDAICGYDGGQVYLYSGPTAQAQWEAT
jgi:hypothetical protein